MAQIREIKKRITAVGTIQRITRTMQMIATAKFTAAVQRTKETKPYTETIRRLVGEVGRAAGDIEHPLIDGPGQPVKRELLLVITSDRGMCGAYNANVLRVANNAMKSARERGVDLDIESVGKKADGFFRFQKITVAETHSVGDPPQYDDVDAIASRYLESFTKGEYDAVSVCSMKFESVARQSPEVLQLLPIRPDDAEVDGDDASANVSASANYEFSPSAEELLADLLPLAVKSQLFQAFNDATVSEQIMRMIAMKAASENAKDLGRTLKRDFNRARQAQITTELTEIISGVAALE